jgi:hypothetical protein
MTSDAVLPKNLLILGTCTLLAVFLGYALTDPFVFQNLTAIGLVIFTISLPIWLRWHQVLMLIFWNSTLVAFFLPGMAPIWVPAACVSLMFSIIKRTLLKEQVFISVPELSLPLIILFGVVFITGMINGGLMGGRALGSETWGAKRYYTTFGAIIGFFAFTAFKIPREKAMLYSGLFILSGVVSAGSDLVYQLGPKFYYLYMLFNPELAGQQATTQDLLNRLTGVSWAASAVIYFMIMKYGIRGIFDITKFWRILIMLGLLVLSMVGGYRSVIILTIIIFIVQFYYEGLFRTVFFVVFSVMIGFSFFLLCAFADRLPLSIQRSISFLPVNIDQVAKADANSTVEWRLHMWKVVLPEVPKYLILGKGYKFSGVDYELTLQAVQRNVYDSFEHILISGNYHNGWLTILIPFGIFGLLAFLWFVWKGYRALYHNYIYSPPDLKRINSFILSLFVSRVIFYLTFYGQFDLDLQVFTGLVGFSIALNHGIRVAKPVPETEEKALPVTEGKTKAAQVLVPPAVRSFRT